MTDNNLLWLLKWYYSQCDGDWEHEIGIEIRTLDNPGWIIRIGLNYTELMDKEFQEVAIDRNENDWIRCYIENKIFIGAGGPLNLPEILEIFHDWVTDKRQ